MKNPQSSPEYPSGSPKAAPERIYEKPSLVKKIRNASLLCLGVGSAVAFGTCCSVMYNQKPPSLEAVDADWYNSPEDVDERNIEIIKFMVREIPKIIMSEGIHPFNIFKDHFNFKGLTFEVQYYFDIQDDGTLKVPFYVKGPEGPMQFIFHDTLVFKKPDIDV